MKAPSSLSRWLDHLSVRQQLFGAFISLLLLTAALGGSALLGLRSVDAEASALSQKWLKGVGELSNARSMLVEYRDNEIRHSRTGDKSYHAEYESKMAEIDQNLKALLGGYQQRVQGDEEAALMAQLDKTVVAYRDATAKVVKFGRDQAQQDAADVSDGLASMAFDEAVMAVNDLIQFNNAGGEAAAATVSSVYAQARIGVIAILTFALVAGVVVAGLITSRLIAQLGGEPRTAVAVARAVAEGDLSTPIHLRAGDSSSLLAWLNTMQQSLARAVSEVRRSSDHVSHASQEIAAGNQDLSGRTEQQASELQQTAATMDQLGSTVKVNAENALQASQLAQGASVVAVRGGDVVSRVVETMKGINESSRRINDIIGVIDGIAFQTNILALNAAVEAARAGEQGRGFAVVAGEVRNLAQRSAEAAKEIKGLIGASVERVEQGTVLVDEAGATMKDVVESIRKVSEIVSGISDASAEQSAGVSQVGEAITRMDQGTQQNAALVEQSAAAAEALKQQATQLVQAVSVFRVGHH